MNYFKNLVLLSIVLFAFSCSDDSDDPATCEFLTQNIQGEIEGAAWTFQGGSVELDTDDNTYSVDLFGMDEDLSGGVCSIFFGSEDRVFFSNLPAAVGEYTLSSDFTTGMTVTLYSVVTSVNVIATQGCVAITSITADAVTVQFDIDYDGDNSLNGTASLDICQ